MELDEIQTIMAPPSNKQLWNLDRIDQPNMPLSRTAYNPLYTGAGVQVYVLDTGINPNHDEYVGRVVNADPGFAPGDINDGHSHGTHCAGTVGGANVGAAPNADLYGVKVLSDQGSGNSAGIARGARWAVERQKNNHGGKTMIISMSLGGGGQQGDR